MRSASSWQCTYCIEYSEWIADAEFRKKKQKITVCIISKHSILHRALSFRRLDAIMIMNNDTNENHVNVTHRFRANRAILKSFFQINSKLKMSNIFTRLVVTVANEEMDLLIIKSFVLSVSCQNSQKRRL
jgi:hypothetical protein